MAVLSEQELFYVLAQEIYQASLIAAAEESLEESAYPSSSELARRLNVKLETVKKRLRTLQQAGLLHPICFSPKRYRFEPYVLRHLEPDHPLFFLQERLFAESD